MDELNGGLKDIFKTILEAKPGNGDRPPQIVINGNGNVIAPGGTVHVMQTPARLHPQLQGAK